MLQEKLPDGQLRETKISYARESTDSAAEAKLVLKGNRDLLVTQEKEQLSFRDIILKRWFGMEEAHDICCSDMAERKIERRGAIPGYDIKDALFGNSIQLRWLEANKSIHCWKPLAQTEETRVIFCRNVGSVITCKASSDGSFTHASSKYTLSCLLHSLDILDSKSSGHGFDVCEGYKWIPTGFSPYEDTIRATCSHNLQRLSEVQQAQPRKLQKLKRRTKPEKRNNYINLPESDAVITFGV